MRKKANEGKKLIKKGLPAFAFLCENHLLSDFACDRIILCFDQMHLCAFGFLNGNRKAGYYFEYGKQKFY